MGRPRWRFTTRRLMAMIAALAVALGAGSALWRVSAPYRAVAEIERLDGSYCGVTRGGPVPPVILMCLGDRATDADLARFPWAAVPEVERLNLFGTRVTDAGLAHLRGLPNLERLSLGHTKVVGPGLVHLAALPRLRHLDLAHSGVTDAGLAYLEDLKGLDSVDLINTAVTDAGLSHLGRLPNLRFVYLKGSRVTAAGAERLRRAMPRTSVLD